jgi:hypothetical protein
MLELGKKLTEVHFLELPAFSFGARERGGQRSEQRTEVRRSQRRIRPLADRRSEVAKFQKRHAQSSREPQNPKSELRASCRCASVAVWPNGSVSITPKRSDSAACKPLLFRARALHRGRAHRQQSPRGLGARPARASPRPDSIPARSAELTWPPVQ